MTRILQPPAITDREDRTSLLATASRPPSKRVFIADPVCALPYGHNATGIRGFTATLSRYFSKTVPLVCQSLPADVEMPPGTDRAFSFYYADQIQLPTAFPLSKRRKALLRDWRNSVLAARRFAARNLKLPLVQDPNRARARKDWRAIFARYSISDNDTIFFPSGDYYGVRGLLHFLETRPFRAWPVIHIHLIHVMEHGCRHRSDAARALYSDLIASGVVGRRLFVSAEAPAYAAFLSDLLMTKVVDFPFPPLVQPEPMVKKEFFLAAALGSGRGDKGYFRLAAIAENYATLYPGDRVRFAVQGMSPEHPEYNPSYETRLNALPNVRKAPHRLSNEEMHALYREADLLLLPYCQRTYQLRGSAVMSEGYGYGRPMLASRGTAFEGIINRYGNGRHCSTDDEFCEALHEHYLKPLDERATRAEEARRAFVADYESKIRLICERLLAAAEASQSGRILRSVS